MNPELFDALTQLKRERGIDLDYMSEKIASALSAAYKKNKDGYTGNVAVELDWENKIMRMYVQKEVVEDVISPSAEITLDEARHQQRYGKEYPCELTTLPPTEPRQYAGACHCEGVYPHENAAAQGPASARKPPVC